MITRLGRDTTLSADSTILGTHYKIKFNKLDLRKSGLKPDKLDSIYNFVMITT